MVQEQLPAALPEEVEIVLRHPRRKETRTYTQTELALDGEARLIQLAAKAASVLAQGGYTLTDIWQMFEVGMEKPEDVEWGEATTLIEYIAAYAPALLAEATTVYLGIFPTDELGNPNPEYEDHLAFIRGSVRLATFVDMTRLFMRQNDYRRLLAPFSKTLADAAGSFGGASDSGEPEPSPGPSQPQRVEASDGSSIELEPEPEPTPTPVPSAPRRRRTARTSDSSGSSES